MYIDFRADLPYLPAGGCTSLRWDVEGVRGVYLDGQGQPGLVLSGDFAEFGGGIYNLGSSSTLTNVTFRGNYANFGGGICSNSSTSILTNVTFSGNSADMGGAMYDLGGNPILTNVTFSGNAASSLGGGAVYQDSSPAILDAIFWGNTASTGAQVYNLVSTSTIHDSIVQNGCPTDSTCVNVIGLDPRLGTLGAYGGGTLTVPLLPGSRAIDAGKDATCASTDQRDLSRYGSACDLGAFESHGFTLTRTSGDVQSTVINSAFATPLGLTVSGAYSEPVDNGVIAFTAPTSGASTGSAAMTAAISSGTVSRSVSANGNVGSYTVTANAAGATVPVMFALTNTKANTVTSVATSPNPSLVGDQVIVSFTVSVGPPASGTPSGTVTVTASGETTTCTATLPTSSCQLTFTTPGIKTQTAIYSGDSRFFGSTSANATHTVHPGVYLPLLRK